MFTLDWARGHLLFCNTSLSSPSGLFPILSIVSFSYVTKNTFRHPTLSFMSGCVKLWMNEAGGITRITVSCG